MCYERAIQISTNCTVINKTFFIVRLASLNLTNIFLTSCQVEECNSQLCQICVKVYNYKTVGILIRPRYIITTILQLYIIFSSKVIDYSEETTRTYSIGHLYYNSLQRREEQLLESTSTNLCRT